MEKTARRFLHKYDAQKGAWLKAAERFAVLLIAALLVSRFLLGVSMVSGESMYPTLNNGAVVVYSRVGSDYSRGDIVSLKMAYGEYYIKRVVAVAGDTVDLRGGILYVNDVPETGDWAHGLTEEQSEAVAFPLTVPEGRLFVMGDNREVSVDSRTFGAVAVSQIRGKVLFHIG